MRRLPTTDLYFLNAYGGEVARWWRRGSVRALGANTFRCGDSLLLIRRDDESLMHAALRWPHRLVYLIDDDIAGAAESAGLPDDYRRRLAEFDRDYHRALVERADRLVVTSPTLKRLFVRHRSVTALDPYWPVSPAGTDHFESVGRVAPIRLVHLGSGSHRAGLERLAPAILRGFDSGWNATFTYVGREGDHPELERHPRIDRVQPMRWSSYRRWIGRQRFHIGLYPLADTPFDRARSANKIIEHGIVGAVGMYPANWEPAERLGTGAIFAPAEPDDWFESLDRGVNDPKWLEFLVRAAKDRLPLINGAPMQRRAWRELLEASPE